MTILSTHPVRPARRSSPAPVSRTGFPVPSAPLQNIREQEHAYILEFAVPGLQKADFAIELNDRVLHIRIRKPEPQSEPVNVLVREFGPVQLDRKYQLGETIDPEKIAATLEAGILTIVLPKVEKPIPRKIEVS